jgi:GT2 family glycosyltransferase
MTAARPHVSILIISYNTREMTLACMRSVFGETRDVEFEVIVVDNASTDGSADAIAAEFPQVRLFALQDNLGFAGGNNFAAQHATGDWLLLLNPDTVVLDRAIDRLVAFAEQQQQADPGVGIFGGRTLFGDRALNRTSCHGRPTLWSLTCAATGLMSLFRGSPLFHPEGYGAWPRDTVRQVDIVSGCFFLLRRELWHQLDGFDPAFFMYGEEADLCLRARRTGVRAMITPDATIIHHGGASEKVRADKMVRLMTAKVLLIRRHFPVWQRGLGVALFAAWPLSRAVALSLLALVQPRRRETAATWRQVWRRRREWLCGRFAQAPQQPATTAAATGNAAPALDNAAAGPEHPQASPEPGANGS